MDVDASKSLEEETKYKLKLDTPSEPALDVSGGEESLDSFDDAEGGLDLGGGEEPGAEEKPFDDEPFDAGVEASEEEDPEKYIQQLSGKLGTTLRKYADDLGQPDLDLEKFAINSVISATHTSDMSEEDQDDIIKKVKMSGAGDEEGGDEEVPAEEPTDELPAEEPAPEGGEGLDLGGGEEELEEVTPGGCIECDEEPAIDGKALEALKDIAKLQESEKKSIFVKKGDMKDLIKGKLDEMAEPTIKPAPTVIPETKPASPRRKTIWETKPIVKPNPKMEEDND